MHLAPSIVLCGVIKPRALCILISQSLTMLYPQLPGCLICLRSISCDFNYASLKAEHSAQRTQFLGPKVAQCQSWSPGAMFKRRVHIRALTYSQRGHAPEFAIFYI